MASPRAIEMYVVDRTEGAVDLVNSLQGKLNYDCLAELLLAARVITEKCGLDRAKTSAFAEKLLGSEPEVVRGMMETYAGTVVDRTLERVWSQANDAQLEE